MYTNARAVPTVILTLYAVFKVIVTYNASKTFTKNSLHV